MNKKLQHVQRTISLVEGDSQKSADFSDIKGPIVGFGLRPIGTIPAGKSADITIKDGATTVVMPIDISVPDVTNKNSFINGIVTPFVVENPGDISATIIPSEPLGVGESYKVKVIIFYAVERSGDTVTSINDCI